MKNKVLEIRDIATAISVLAIKAEGEDKAEQYHLWRSGLDNKEELFVILIELRNIRAEFKPRKWSASTRTMEVAHEYIRKNFDKLNSGDVVDVEYILGEREKPKRSEMYDNPF